MHARSGRTETRTAVALAGVLAIATWAGCGETTPGAASGPLTAPALAWLVDQHVDGDASSAQPMYVEDLEALGESAVGVDLRFRPSEGDDGDLVRVFVAPWESEGMDDYRDVAACEPGDDCVVVDGVTVSWERGAPEEDPGYVAALRHEGDLAVFALSSGPFIDGDPREADLAVSVDDLVGLVSDPRVAPTTTGEALAEGARFEVYDDPATPGRDLPDPDLTDQATPATLALLAEDHTSWDAEAGRADPDVPAPGVGAVLDFPAQSGWEATTLRLRLEPRAASPSAADLRRTAGCAAADGCAPEADTMVSWRVADGDDPGSITVVGWREGALLTATWAGHPVEGDPRDRDGPVLVEEVAALVDDPHLGLLTSADLADRASDMPSWWEGSD